MSGPLDAGQGLVQRSQVRADGTSPIAEEAADLLIQDATLAGPRAQLPGLVAGRAATPEDRVGVEAPGAQRFLTGTAADGGHGAAPGAGCPPLLAAVAPRLAGGPGYLASRGPPADSADQDLARAAVLAPRPVFEPDGDPAAAPAAGAFLKVDRVADQAVRTQRVAVSISGGRFSDTAAAPAWHGRRPGEAVPADTLTIQQLRQGLHRGAARAGRPDDLGSAGRDEPVDEPQHRRSRRVGARPGEQVGARHDRPGQTALPGRPGGGLLHRRRDRFPAEPRVKGGHELRQFLQRVTAGVRAVLAAVLSVTVQGDRPPLFATACAGTDLLQAPAAAPAATALAAHVTQFPHAPAAPGRRDPGSSRRPQGEQQPRRR